MRRAVDSQQEYLSPHRQTNQRLREHILRACYDKKATVQAPTPPKQAFAPEESPPEESSPKESPPEESPPDESPQEESPPEKSPPEESLPATSPSLNKRVENHFCLDEVELTYTNKLLTVTEGTFYLLGRVKTAEHGLYAETDVINFLLTLYFTKWEGSKQKPWPCCQRCSAALTLVCQRCERSRQPPGKSSLCDSQSQDVPLVPAPSPPSTRQPNKDISCPLKDKCTCCCKRKKCTPVGKLTNQEKSLVESGAPSTASAEISMVNSLSSVKSVLTSEEEKNSKDDENDDLPLPDLPEGSIIIEESDETYELCKVSIPKKPLTFTCNSCDEKFSHASSLAKHKWKWHCPKESKQCKICSLLCATVLGLRKHIITHKKEIPNLCVHCCQTFATSLDLKKHCRVCPCRQLYSCNMCDKVYTRKYFLDEHMSKHTGHTPYLCEFCSQSFGSPDGLRRHLDIHTGKTQCNVCGKIFAHLTGLRDHKLIHTGQRPHVCLVCGKTFIYMQSLRVHMLTHTGLRPHKCDLCSKAFAQAVALRLHRSIHTGAKTQACHLCGLSFARYSTLRAHMLTHTGQKKHMCTVCGKGFTQKKILKWHMSTHTGITENICKVCGKSFAWQKSLKNHLLSKHGIGGDIMTGNSSREATAAKDMLKDMSPVCNESVDTGLSLFHNVTSADSLPWVA